MLTKNSDTNNKTTHKWHCEVLSVAWGLLTLLAFISSCSSDDTHHQPDIVDPTQEMPLTFTAITANKEESTTRAVLTAAEAAEALNYTFNVSGVKFTNTTSDMQIVFNNTPVSYRANTAGTTSSNTANWEYVNGGEYIRYWDQEAKGYGFFGYSIKDGSSVTAETSSESECYVTLNNLQGGAKSPTTTAYFSLPTSVNPKAGSVAFQDAVTMTFIQPLARIRIGFISGDESYDEFDNKWLGISEVSFTEYNEPAATENKVAKKGDIKATYTWNYSSDKFECNYLLERLSAQTENIDTITFNNYKAYANGATCYQIESKNYVEDALFAYATETTYNDSDADEEKAQEVKALHNNPTEGQRKAWEEKQWYYVFPQTGKEWQLKVTTDIDGIKDRKSAIVPAEYLRWEPNHQYTYIFKVSSGALAIYKWDVDIIDWKFGGAADLEYRNW